MQQDNRPSWAVIFDVDGTMVNNIAYHQKAWIEFGRRNGITIDEDYYRRNIHSRGNNDIVRNNFPHLIKEGSGKNGESVAAEKEMIYREMFRPVVTEIAGLRRLVEELHAAGVPMAAASNSPGGNVEMVLSELGIEKFFEVVIDCEQVRRGKPDPEIFLTAAEKMDIEPGRCVVVEDSISGFEAARRAKAMVHEMDHLGFGNCTNEKECEAECPKEIKITNIARLNRQYLKSRFFSTEK